MKLKCNELHEWQKKNSYHFFQINTEIIQKRVIYTCAVFIYIIKWVCRMQGRPKKKSLQIFICTSIFIICLLQLCFYHIQRTERTIMLTFFLKRFRYKNKSIRRNVYAHKCYCGTSISQDNFHHLLIYLHVSCLPCSQWKRIILCIEYVNTCNFHFALLCTLPE